MSSNNRLIEDDEPMICMKLIKDGEHFVYLFEQRYMDGLPDLLRSQISDPRLNFDPDDALMVMKKAYELAEDE